MSRRLHFSYSFLPVGQGLFAYGSLRWIDHQFPQSPSIRLLWVYDCGTSSGQALIDEGLDRLAVMAGARQQVDLLFLSHFDHDHISGVCRLLGRMKVETLVLPFMPLEQRLLLALEEGAEPEDSLMRFMLDPVSFLREQDGPGIGRILFVPRSVDDGPPLPEGVPPESPPDDSGSDNGFEIRFRESSSDELGELDRLSQYSSSGASPSVSLLAPSSSILAGALWEFAPYNDDPGVGIDPTFVEAVKANRNILLGATGEPERRAALSRIKELYTRTYGRSSHEKNSISLFIHSGPIYPRWNHSFFTGPWPFWEWSVDDIRCFARAAPHSWEGVHDKRCSILYTGDGYLDSHEALDRLVSYLRPERVSRTAVFQVMHHGAEGNWHKGVATTINPLFSVFCSDPTRKRLGHPHASVLRDFWSHRPVQVDKQCHFTTSGTLS